MQFLKSNGISLFQFGIEGSKSKVCAILLKKFGLWFIKIHFSITALFSVILILWFEVVVTTF